MKSLLTYLLFLCSFFSMGQKTIDEVLEKYNTKTVPYITVDSLKYKKGIALLDAREFQEYKVSHIKSANYIGHKKFKKKKMLNLVRDKDMMIVVYCSIGVRSEEVAIKIKKLGYTNVYNLYGGIFEWKNQNGEVVDDNEAPTNKVHVYSKKWGKYLKKGKKVY